MSAPTEFILTLSCRDAKGIVYAVSGLLYQAGCNIVDSQQFGDVQSDDGTGLFFMRVHFEAPPHLRDGRAQAGGPAREALAGGVRLVGLDQRRQQAGPVGECRLRVHGVAGAGGKDGRDRRYHAGGKDKDSPPKAHHPRRIRPRA